MSDSPVSIASNRKVGILLFERSFTFPYISDIILRDSDQVSAKRGWSPTYRQDKAKYPCFLVWFLERKKNFGTVLKAF